MALEPLRSALSIGEMGETSLALPSDGFSGSGQRRVMEQVSTMRKSKSKYSRGSTGGTLSPTSPKSDSVFYDYKFPSANLNGLDNMYESTMANGHTQMRKQKQGMMQRSISTRSANYQRIPNNNALLQSLPTLAQPSVQPDPYSAQVGYRRSSTKWNQTCRQSKSLDRSYSNSAPISPTTMAVSRSFHSTGNQLPGIYQSTNNQLSGIYQSTNNQLSGNYQSTSNQFPGNYQSTSNQLSSSFQATNNQFPGNFQATNNQFSSSNTIGKRPPSAHSISEQKLSVMSRTKSEMNGMNGEAAVSDMSLEEAISCIRQQDEMYQLHGASVIQHKTFTDENQREEVRKLKGIPPLVLLLSSSNSQIQLTAASALRNIIYKNTANKNELRREAGVDKVLDLLNSNSAEIHKHVTGLLWNLSSEDSIQPELLNKALPVLTKTILEPNADPSTIDSDLEARTESFCNATACLRNLSSGKMVNRRTLRNCPGLIDSLITHMQYSVDNETMDNKSLENCVCVLHNLTYQLESEAPDLFAKINREVKGSENSDENGPIGCFSNQSRKAQEQSNITLKDDSKAKDKFRLIHSNTLQLYLKLLHCSQNTSIQEACCGALNNLTAKKGVVSDLLSTAIVQKLGGHLSICPHLESQDLSMKKSATTLMGNLSRTPQLHKVLAHTALPSVLKVVTSDLTAESDSMVAVACHMTNNLLRAEPEFGKKYLNTDLISSVINISEQTDQTKSNQAAGVLLQSLWSDKVLQSSLKKLGMSKCLFVNDQTSDAMKSLRVDN